MLKIPILTKSEKLRLVLIVSFIGLFFGQKDGSMQIFLLLGTIIFFLSIIWKNFWLGLVAAFLLSTSFSVWRITTDLQNDELSQNHTEIQEITGFVSSFPDQREKNNRAIITTKQGKLLLVVTPLTELHYGDELKFTGKLTRPRNFQDFDYQEYLRRFGVQTIVRYPSKLEILSTRTQGNWLLRVAAKTRQTLSKNLERALPLPHNKIAMGILLGVKNELPPTTKKEFTSSGLQHLLVVSGFNVTIIIIFISLFLRKWGRRAVFVGSILALIFFVAMTGLEAPVLRASLMGSIVAWSVALGKFSDVRNLIFFSMVVIGLFSPRLIQTDVGFFLSTLATLGIIFGVPVFEKISAQIPNKLGIKTLLIVTLSAQIAVLPILGLYFGSFPVVGLLSNLLAEPLIPLNMLFSFIVTLTGLLPEFVATIIAIPAFIGLEILLQIAHVFGQIDPLPVSKLMGNISLVIVISFFLWASLSRTFAQKFLIDFSKQKLKNQSK